GKTLYSESVLVTSTRHQEALRRIVEHLRASQASLVQELPLDFVSIDLRAAYSVLGEITGETARDDLLDRIVSEFCMGKYPLLACSRLSLSIKVLLTQALCLHHC